MARLDARTHASLRDARAHYLTLIDNAAAHQRYLDPAQCDVYRQKVAEARQGGGHRLEEEAGMLGIPLDVLTSAVLHQHERRQTMVQTVEMARIKAKRDIRDAPTPAAMDAIVNAFKQQLSLL